DVCAGGTVDFSLSYPATITLTSGVALTLTKDVTIAGPGADKVAVSGNAATRVFVVNSGVRAAIDGLTIRDGKITGFTNGAGILNSGVLTVTNSVLAANNTQNEGGGIYNIGTLTVLSNTFADNAAFRGAGIYNSGSLVVAGTGFERNDGSSEGGGIHNTGTTNVIESAFVANRGYMGGGVFSSGTFTATNSSFRNNSNSGNGGGIGIVGGTAALYNSTVYSNAATFGGGIYVSAGALTVTNSTVANNSAPYGGGIYNGSMLYLRNSLIANSTGSSDCINSGTLAANTNNLIADGSCSPALSGDPLLGAFGDYGGDTQTVPLLPGSPAIDAGDGATCLATDQRGVERPEGTCDIGAFESRGFTLAKGTGDGQSTAWGMAFAAPITVAVSSAYTEPVDGGQVTYAGPLSGAGTA
ncbi:MAG: hypothetical protein KDE24_03745, partial [Caldilinea sp.]|nr:hypothetical protein [Caldilinea sp.]